MQTPVADLPGWMHDHAFNEASDSVLDTPSDDSFFELAATGFLTPGVAHRFAEQAFNEGLGAVESAAQGNRRTLLNATAFKVGRWGAMAGWTESDWRTVADAFIAAAIVADLPEDEARTTTSVALKDGAATFRKLTRT
ncbi:MAG: hypothetical protein NTX33_16370 [Propionibacteriales bacterium]|nr:hypothetical protein [Propionibacteriales bacterium]